MEALPAHDVYDNVANPDEDMDNVKLPYIIVNNDGGQNIAESKDDNYESEDDRVNISVRITACNRQQLDAIASEVRKTIRQYMIDMDNAEPGQEGELFDLKPYDYEMSFSDISFVPDKPCHQIVLYYMCQVGNDLNEENDEQENL
jgi:hypothetical protein